MFLNRADLLKTLEPKKETVEIDGGDVIITEIGASDLIGLYSNEDFLNESGSLIMNKFTPALVAKCVVDEAGNRIFSDSDIPLLEKASATQFAKIAAVARRLNGLAGTETKN